MPLTRRERLERALGPDWATTAELANRAGTDTNTSSQPLLVSQNEQRAEMRQVMGTQGGWHYEWRRGSLWASP